MLLSQKIVVWTERKNVTYKNTEHASDRLHCQRLLLEEYAVQLKFIEGIKNNAADMLIRKKLFFGPTATVSSKEFEAMMHNIHTHIK